MVNLGLSTDSFMDAFGESVSIETDSNAMRVVNGIVSVERYQLEDGRWETGHKVELDISNDVGEVGKAVVIRGKRYRLSRKDIETDPNWINYYCNR